MKKILKVLFTAVFLIGAIPTISVQATEKVKDSDYTVVDYDYKQSEYLMLKNAISKLEKKTTNIYSKSYFEDSEELIMLKEELDNYPNVIYELKEKDIEYLKTLNYDDNQIDAIKNFNGTEEEILRASAYATVAVYVSGFTYRSTTNTTVATVESIATWHGKPTFSLEDQLSAILIFGDGNTIPNSRICYGTYSASDGDSFQITLSTKSNNPVLTACDLPKEQYHTIKNKTGWLSGARIIFSGEVSGNVSVLTAKGVYLRGVISLGSSFGIGISGTIPSVSITIGNGYELMDDTDWEKYYQQ